MRWSVTGSRNQARIRSRSMLLRNAVFRRLRWPRRERSRHELVHQLMQADLPAQVFHSGAQAVARVPAAYAQFPRLLRSHKPMVRLLLFRCANVTRYCLPDHCIPPKAAPSRRGVKCLARSFPSTAGAMILTPQPEPANPIGIVWESPLSIFIARRKETVNFRGERMRGCIKTERNGERPSLIGTRIGSLLAWVRDTRSQPGGRMKHRAPCPVLFTASS